jgi:hypothetical protein
MATIEQLIDRVRQKTMVGTSELTDAGLILWFNDATDEISNRFDNEWLVGIEDLTTVASTQNYTPTADVVSIIAIVQDGTRKSLDPITRTDVLSRYGDDIPEAAVAKWYYWWDGDIFLVPTPNAVVIYHMNLLGVPATFTTSSDSPAFLPSHHNVLADYVEARVWEREEEFEKAIQAQARFEAGARNLRLAYQSRVNGNPWAFGDGRPSNFARNDPFGEDWGLA